MNFRMDFQFHCDSCPEDQELRTSMPASSSRIATFTNLPLFPRHSRSLSAPVYQPSGTWDFLHSVNKQQHYQLNSCRILENERRRKRKLTLELEVRELEKRLHTERSVGKALQQALGSSFEKWPPSGMHRPMTQDLIEEVEKLEVDVMYLETMCRKLKKLSHLKKSHHRRHASAAQSSRSSDVSRLSITRTRHTSLFGGNSSIDECRGSTDLAIEVYVPEKARESLKNALKKERRKRTPNELSEEMVRCMAAIYCKLSDPPLLLLGGGQSISPPFSASTRASTSSASTSRDVSSSDSWSPHWKGRAVEGVPPIIEVLWIQVDKERLGYAARALRSFKSLVEQLERVHPREMKHEEKLAFWINVYNALVMHAYLAYGIPRNHVNRVSLLQKAAYKVGAYSVNAYTIEHSILGFRPQRPAQWLQSIFHAPVTKFRTDERKAYTLNAAEPMVCFAICSGGRSDPMVRVYTPENIRKELEAAKREFMQTNLSIRDNKVVLPKLVETYARDAKMKLLLDWIYQNATEGQQQELIKARICCMPQSISASCTGPAKSKSAKTSSSCEWLPYDFEFKYCFPRELATRCSS